jgi:hypothetical protein
MEHSGAPPALLAVAREGLNNVSVCAFYIFSSRLRLSLLGANGCIAGGRNEFNRSNTTDEYART